MVLLSNHDYLEVLKCEEYANYVIRKYDEPDCFYIHFAKMPKSHYLSIEGDCVFGYLFSEKLNNAQKVNGLVKIGILK